MVSYDVIELNVANHRDDDHLCVSAARLVCSARLLAPYPPTVVLSLSHPTMKITAALALAAASSASAYSVNRSTLRSLGQKSVSSASRSHVRSNDIKMEGECNVLILNGPPCFLGVSRPF